MQQIERDNNVIFYVIDKRFAAWKKPSVTKLEQLWGLCQYTGCC